MRLKIFFFAVLTLMPFLNLAMRNSTKKLETNKLLLASKHYRILHPNYPQLIQKETKIHADKYGLTPLHYLALSDTRGFDLEELCNTYPSYVNHKDPQGNTPLHKAACAGNSNAITILLNYNSDPNKQNNYGKTPLHHALFFSDQNTIISIAALLIKAGSNPNEADRFGWTPLHLAMWLEKFIVAAELLKLGASPTAQTHDHKTPLALGYERDLFKQNRTAFYEYMESIATINRVLMPSESSELSMPANIKLTK